jgi:hypothetical protein
MIMSLTWDELSAQAAAIQKRGDELNRRYDRAMDGSEEKREIMAELAQLSRDRTAYEVACDEKCEAEGLNS